jgi:hypothetical protein
MAGKLRPEPRNPIPARHRSEPLSATALITTNRNINQDLQIRVRRWTKEAAFTCVKSPSINHIHEQGESRAAGEVPNASENWPLTATM